VQGISDQGRQRLGGRTGWREKKTKKGCLPKLQKEVEGPNQGEEETKKEKKKKPRSRVLNEVFQAIKYPTGIRVVQTERRNRLAQKGTQNRGGDLQPQRGGENGGKKKKTRRESFFRRSSSKTGRGGSKKTRKLVEGGGGGRAKPSGTFSGEEKTLIGETNAAKQEKATDEGDRALVGERTFLNNGLQDRKVALEPGGKGAGEC